MKTVINKYTGEELYSTMIEVKLKEDEILVDAISGDILKPFYNFDTKEFYETATQEEIEAFNNSLEL
jgi:hypothetical protein